MDLFSESISDTSGRAVPVRRVFLLWVLFTGVGYVAPLLVWGFVPKQGAWIPLLYPLPIVLLSVIQWRLLRRYVPELNIWAWVISSAIGQILSYGVGVLLSLIYLQA